MLCMKSHMFLLRSHYDHNNLFMFCNLRKLFLAHYMLCSYLGYRSPVSISQGSVYRED